MGKGRGKGKGKPNWTLDLGTSAWATEKEAWKIDPAPIAVMTEYPYIAEVLVSSLILLMSAVPTIIKMMPPMYQGV